MPSGDRRDLFKTGAGRPITRIRRALGGLATAFALVGALVWGILSLTWPDSPVNINVR